MVFLFMEKFLFIKKYIIYCSYKNFDIDVFISDWLNEFDDLVVIYDFELFRVFNRYVFIKKCIVIICLVVFWYLEELKFEKMEKRWFE